MNSLTQFLDWNSIAATMLMIIIRSICAGIAAGFLAAGLCLFVGLPIASYFLSRSAPPESGGNPEVGWDVVTMAHNSPTGAVLIPLLIFTIGLFLGLRHFSKSLARK
jgi:hypothetical protein